MFVQIDHRNQATPATLNFAIMKNKSLSKTHMGESALDIQWMRYLLEWDIQKRIRSMSLRLFVYLTYNNNNLSNNAIAMFRFLY